MRAGVARADITPPVGAPILSAGYVGGGVRGERVADDLSATALVIEDDSGTRAAVVSLDLIGTLASFSDPIRERAGESAGIGAAEFVNRLTD